MVMGRAKRHTTIVLFEIIQVILLKVKLGVRCFRLFTHICRPIHGSPEVERELRVNVSFWRVSASVQSPAFLLGSDIFPAGTRRAASTAMLVKLDFSPTVHPLDLEPARLNAGVGSRPPFSVPRLQ